MLARLRLRRLAKQLAGGRPPDERERAVNSIAELAAAGSHRAIPHLTELGVPGFDRSIKGDHEDFLRLASSSHVEALLVAMRAEDWEARARAAKNLGKCDDRRAVAPLLVALEDESPSVRRAAAGGLGCLGDPRALVPLVRAFGSGHGDTSSAAADALKAFGSAAVVALPPLLVVVRSGRSTRRAAAAQLIGEIGCDGAAEGLAEILCQRKPEVRQAVAGALDKLSGPDSSWGRLVRGDDQDFRRLGRSGRPEATRALLSGLASEDSSLRSSAAKGASLAAGSDAAQALLDYVLSVGARYAAKRAPFPLIVPRADELAASLLKLLESDERSARKVAVKTLVAAGRAHPNRDALRDRVDSARADLDERGRANADEVLRRWGSDAIPATLGEHPRAYRAWLW